MKTYRITATIGYVEAVRRADTIQEATRKAREMAAKYPGRAVRIEERTGIHVPTAKYVCSSQGKVLA